MQNPPLLFTIGGDSSPVKRQRKNKIIGKHSTIMVVDECKHSFREWTHNHYFVFNGGVFELQNKLADKEWVGKNPYTMSGVRINQDNCVYIQKNEPILKLYIVLNERLKYIETANISGDKPTMRFELNNMIKYCEKIIIESFTI